MALRTAPVEQFLRDDGGVDFYAGDTYDHMRRARLILNDFPSLPAYSFYQGYPVGSPYLPAPGFDLMIAITAKAVGLGNPSSHTVDMVGFVAPVVLGGLTVLAIYLLLLEFMGMWPALFGAAVFSVLPSYLGKSFIAQPDNNAAEPLFAAIYFLFLLRALGETKGRMLYPVFTGLSGVLTLLIWRGSGLFWAIAASVIILSTLVKPERSSWTLKAGATAFTLQGVILFVFAWQNIFLFKNTISYNALSYFHAIFSLLVGLGLFSVLYGRGKLRNQRLWSDALLMFAPTALCVVAFPSLVVQLAESLSFMAQGNPWTKDILEYQPIIRDMNLLAPVGLLSWLFWLVPPGILAAAYYAFKGGEHQDQAGFFLFSGIVFLLSTLSHQRFGTLLQINIAIIAGLLVQHMPVYAKKTSMKAVAWIVLLLMLMPALKNAYLFTKNDLGIFVRQKAIMHAMEWIRDNTPPTSHFMEPWNKPEYGVMASWDEGSWIENVARRPAVATLFGTEIHGLEESARFTLESDEKAALEILGRNNVRYVIVRNMVASLANYAKIVGIDHKGYSELKDSGDGKSYWQPGPKYFRLVSTRLLYNDGIRSKRNVLDLEKVSRMRLLYESSESFKVIGMAQGPSRIKVFEHVRGTTLKVMTTPGDVVSVSLPLLTNRRRVMEYVDQVEADSRGIARFSLPYCTERWPGRVSAMGLYTVSGGKGKQAYLAISEQMVLEGGELELTLKK